MGTNADELRRDIERTRYEMSENLDAIGDRVSPRRMAERRWQRTRSWFGSARTSVFGSPDDESPSSTGRGERGVTSAVTDTAHQVAGSVQHAPDAIAERTRGNPMVAGAVAFGVGLLGSMVIGATRSERRAFAQLREGIEPIQQGVAESARSVASSMQDAAKGAAQDLRSEAGDRAGHVAEAATGAGSSS